MICINKKLINPTICFRENPQSIQKPCPHLFVFEKDEAEQFIEMDFSLKKSDDELTWFRYIKQIEDIYFN